MTIPKKYTDKTFFLIWLILGLACLFAAIQQMKADITNFNHFDALALIPATIHRGRPGIMPVSFCVAPGSWPPLESMHSHLKNAQAMNQTNRDKEEVI